MINLSAFIRFHAGRTPEAVAIVYGDERITYGALYDRVERLAARLQAMGIGAGDVVAVLMKNSAAFIEIALAVSHIGAVFLPINFRLSSDEVGYILGDAEAKLVFVDEELAPLVSGGVDRLVVDAAAEHDSSLLAGDAGRAAMVVRRPTDLFRLMYTSGTTDHPKGVMHCYENFYWKSSDHVVVLGLSAETRLLVTGPLYHVGAFDLPGIAVLWQGGMLAVIRDFEPSAVLGLIERERLNAAWLAPVMTSALHVYPDRHAYDLSSLRWVVGGGERTPESRIRSFKELFPNARYIDAYGLTESCSGDTFMEQGRELEKIGSTGRATPHVEVEILDDEGRPTTRGVTGEICLRGPKIFAGYWRDPVKTASAITEAGWFRTGDVGHLDEDGFLFVTDRKKDMIISGGENIASSEVERVIQLMPEVGEVAVVGVPDPRWGEVPAAYVVVARGATLDLPRLAGHCRAHLAAFKVPKHLILAGTLPRNPSGKVLKRRLRDEFATRVKSDTGEAQ